MCGEIDNEIRSTTLGIIMGAWGVFSHRERGNFYTIHRKKVEFKKRLIKNKKSGIKIVDKEYEKSIIPLCIIVKL